ncbi:MAG: hypothetical protein QOE22_384 [Candidatus Parcubacteria bacterium]|jgi:hypothetical protein|nr:hypothetical protein [Candidatus Parcubacteria bacterium]
MKTSPFEKPVEKDLGKELLSGTLDPEAFLDELLARDQATGDRRAAIANIKLLTRPDIAEFFSGQSEHQARYEGFLSFSYFHRGQIEAGEGDNGAASASFTQALAWARRAETNDPQERSWRLYVEGTVAYLESDLATLRKVYEDGIEEDRNREIIGNFIRSLETDGKVDYRSAYAK